MHISTFFRSCNIFPKGVAALNRGIQKKKKPEGAVLNFILIEIIFYAVLAFEITFLELKSGVVCAFGPFSLTPL